MDQTGKIPGIIITRSLLLRELRDVILLFLAGYAMAFVYGYRDSAYQLFLVGSYMGVMWVLLWKGNSYLSDGLSLWFDWLKAPLRTFFIGITATLVYTIAVVLLIQVMFRSTLNLSFNDIRLTLWSSVIITLIITLFMHGRSFLFCWRESAINSEKLLRENATARYEVLKNQVSPHFLFNSLNALTNLVHRDPDKAVTFIKQLSEVYRYVLDTRDQEVISLAEELAFLKSYVYLQQIRFGDKLRVQVKMEPRDDVFVTPLALQMLVENAIKHNTIADGAPLEIHLFESEGYVNVENTLQRRESTLEHSSGVGLENISRRYETLGSKKVFYFEKDGKFVVRIPLLIHEGTYH